MKTVTFLIPCYNVAQCVNQCIDTMLAESISDDIEILLVNDGSKDNTLEVLRDYEKRYPNVVRVVDKENGGWGTAINLGIREAKGKYVKEVDADDWVSTENLPEYIAFLKEHDIDYIATDYTEYFKAEDKHVRHSYQKVIYNKPMSLNEFWEQHPTAWDFPIHAITYRTQMLQECGLKVGDRYYGDIEYNLYPAPCADHLRFAAERNRLFPWQRRAEHQHRWLRQALQRLCGNEPKDNRFLPHGATNPAPRLKTIHSRNSVRYRCKNIPSDAIPNLCRQGPRCGRRPSQI